MSQQAGPASSRGIDGSSYAGANRFKFTGLDEGLLGKRYQTRNGLLV